MRVTRTSAAMNIIFTIVFFITMVLFFYTSNNVATLRAQADALGTAVNRDRELLHILKAEWAYLSDPSKIEDAVSVYLNNEYEGTRKNSPRISNNCLGSNVLVFNTPAKRPSNKSAKKPQVTDANKLSKH